MNNVRPGSKLLFGKSIKKPTQISAVNSLLQRYDRGSYSYGYSKKDNHQTPERCLYKSNMHLEN